MRVLLLWADDRSPNLGVRALAEGNEELLHQVWSDAEIVRYNFGSKVIPAPMGSVRSSARELLTSRGGVVRWLRDFDVVVDTRAGDSFADIYGMKRMTVMSGLAEAVRRSGTPYVLAPQTYGPFNTRRSAAMARWSLRSASVVMARDSVSAQVAARLGRPVDALSTDVVFALPVPRQVESEHDVVLNVSGLLWQGQPGTNPTEYRRIVVELVRAWRSEGREVTLLAHVLAGSPKDSDVDVLPEVVAAVGEDVRVVVPEGLADVRQVLAGGVVTVGSRMHCCLNSLSVGVPTVPLAYSRKFAPLLSDIGWDHTVSLAGGGDIVGDVLKATRSDGLSAQVPTALAAASRKLDSARAVLADLQVAR